MKYFTRAWARGELSDTENDRRQKQYWQSVHTLQATTPVSVTTLASRLNLHDGLIQSAIVNPSDRTLRLALIVGDLQVGYSDLVLSYRGVHVSRLDTETLATCAVNAQTELLYDEVDVGEQGSYVHRILFWPAGEIEIVFTTLTYQQENRTDRANSSPPTNRYREEL